MITSIRFEARSRVSSSTWVSRGMLLMLLCLAALLATTFGCGGSRSAEATVSTVLSTVFADYKLTGNVELVRDPSIIRQADTYYLFSTDDGAPVGGSINIRCSMDLISWRDCGHVFDAMPVWVTQRNPGVIGLWAPDISYFNHAYHLYYVGSIFGTNRSVIGLATNVTLDPADPNYTWVDQGEVLRSSSNDDFNALDPNIFIGSNGSIWLTYGSFWSGIKQAPIDPTTGMITGPSREPFSLAARTEAHRAVEAPFIFHHGNYYFLFVSFGLCCTEDPYQSTYRIMVGRSTSIHGPFFDKSGRGLLQGGGTELLSGADHDWNAPGGASLFTDPESGKTTMVFHAHRLPSGSPYLFVNFVNWNDDWPQIVP
jgi:arabinan endo-1,5-alpha-L-arabinosidase